MADCDFPFIPVSTLAARWSVSDSLVYRLYHTGQLAGVRIAKRVLILKTAVEQYEREHSNEPPPIPTPSARGRGRVKSKGKGKAKGLAGFKFVPRPVAAPE